MGTHQNAFVPLKILDEKDLRVLVASKLKMSQQRALAAKMVNTVLGCVNRTVACRLREAIIASYSPRVLPPTQHNFGQHPPPV